jgi:hypothetical protein
MGSFRYRTAALVGDWRSTEDEAMEDAVRARQVIVAGSAERRWLVPGAIEAHNPWSTPGAIAPSAGRNDGERSA